MFDDDSFFNDPHADPNSIFGDTYKSTHHVIIRPKADDNRPVFGSLDTVWNEISKDTCDFDSLFNANKIMPKHRR